MQTWPELSIELKTAPPAARSRFASSQTIIASLPPSSSVYGMSCSAHDAAIFFPVGTLPVNEILFDASVDERRAGFAIAVDDLHDALRHACLEQGTRSAQSPEYGATSDGFKTTACCPPGSPASSD